MQRSTELPAVRGRTSRGRTRCCLTISYAARWRVCRKLEAQPDTETISAKFRLCRLIPNLTYTATEVISPNQGFGVRTWSANNQRTVRNHGASILAISVSCFLQQNETAAVKDFESAAASRERRSASPRTYVLVLPCTVCCLLLFEGCWLKVHYSSTDAWAVRVESRRCWRDLGTLN